MKGMPLTCEFQGTGVLDIGRISADLFPSKWSSVEGVCFVGIEPTSVLETTRSPSPPSSSSTSLGGGGGGASPGMTSVAAGSGSPFQAWPPQQQGTGNASMVAECGIERKEEWGLGELHPIPAALETAVGCSAGDTAASEKSGLAMEDWASLLAESATSPSQEQSILRWIMGDAEADSSMGLNKLLQGDCGSSSFDFHGGFGAVDPEPVVAGAAACGGGNFMGIPCPLPYAVSANPSLFPNSKIPNSSNPMIPPMLSNLLPVSLQPESTEEKPQVFNPQLAMNQHQIPGPQNPQNPVWFLPLSSAHHHEQRQSLPSPPSPPPPKRHNPGGLSGPHISVIPKQPPLLDSGQAQELFNRQQGFPHQFQLLRPHHPSLQQQRPPANVKPKTGGDDLAAQAQHRQQAVLDQLYKAAEMVETGNPELAQGILARLNHQLSPVGKPFFRAAFYFKEALSLLLPTTPTPSPSPFNLISKIEAYKCFSEISPILQFANFTCIQALLETLDGFDRIHILDFDIGYGGQWASLMQELAVRNSGAPPFLKITAFVSAAVHDELELSLTRENLTHFASGINVPFELDIVSLDALNSASWSLPFLVTEHEAIAVNLPVGSSSNYSLPLPLVLPFIKHLSPKIVVSLDRGHERSDLSFPEHVIYALRSHWALLESLDAVNVSPDALQKIERFLLYPDVERIVLGLHRSREKRVPWRTLFLTSGFIPLTLSNLSESQADCVVKRSPVRGFHIEKKHSSLVLCWQRRELISVSAWR